MTRRLASATFLLVAILITLGAYGHGFMGRLNIDHELDKFTIASNVYTMLYLVWYFVSGCMLLFGITLIRTWLQLRQGRRDTLFVAYLIGLLYLLTGVGGIIYRHGDSFQLVFIAEGALVLSAGYLLGKNTRTLSVRG